MELCTGSVPGNESPCRISVNVDLAELDILLANATPIIADRGFTVRDMATHRGVSDSAATRTIHALVKDGKIRFIGTRPGHGMAKVYETVK
jgi:hypothetical protein